jgi:hypothetical protein
VFQAQSGNLVVVPEPSTIVFAGLGVAMSGSNTGALGAAAVAWVRRTEAPASTVAAIATSPRLSRSYSKANSF